MEIISARGLHFPPRGLHRFTICIFYYYFEIVWGYWIVVALLMKYTDSLYDYRLWTLASTTIFHFGLSLFWFVPFLTAPSVFSSFLLSHSGWAVATCSALFCCSWLCCWLSLSLAPSFLWTTTRPLQCLMAYRTSPQIRKRAMPWSPSREATAHASTSSLTPTAPITTVTFCVWKECRPHCCTHWLTTTLTWSQWKARTELCSSAWLRRWPSCQHMQDS